MLIGREDAAPLSPRAMMREIQERMSACAGILREETQVEDAARAAGTLMERARRELRVDSPARLPDAFQALDLCLTHIAYLEALREYLARGGASRGSFLVVHPGGVRVHEKLPDSWRFMPPTAPVGDDGRILQVRLEDGRSVQSRWIDPRPIPRGECWFETVWDDFRHDRVVR
jgi:hypothetical protein